MFERIPVPSSREALLTVSIHSSAIRWVCGVYLSNNKCGAWSRVVIPRYWVGWKGLDGHKKDLLGFDFKSWRVDNYFRSSFVTCVWVLYQRESNKLSENCFGIFCQFQCSPEVIFTAAAIRENQGYWICWSPGNQSLAGNNRGWLWRWLTEP